MADKLRAVPMTLAEANECVARFHRHHQPVRFHLFSIGALADRDDAVGAAIVMRPINQYMSFEGYVAEVCRLATDGTKNACSFLLSRCARAAFEMGYFAIQTYTLPSEGGSSLRAAGWRYFGETRGKAWNTGRRKRNDQHPIGPKHRWMKIRNDVAREIYRGANHAK